jgi:hypothetical protein
MEKTKKRHFWRALGGKDACKYYMFANSERRGRLKAQTAILKTLTVVAALVTFALAAWIAAMVSVWLLGIVCIGIGPMIAWSQYHMNFEQYTAHFLGSGIMTLQWAIWAMLAFIIIYVVKFIIEWIAILAESRELKKDTTKNAHYINISGAIKRVKIVGLLVTVIMGIVVYIGAYFIKQGDDVNGTLAGVLAAVMLAAMLFNKMYSYRQLRRVADDIDAVRSERAEIKAEHKASK